MAFGWTSKALKDYKVHPKRADETGLGLLMFMPRESEAVLKSVLNIPLKLQRFDWNCCSLRFLPQQQ